MKIGERMALARSAFDFLADEPDLYSDADILPGRKNPNFQKASDRSAINSKRSAETTRRPPKSGPARGGE
jgi:hypothetical protein